MRIVFGSVFLLLSYLQNFNTLPWRSAHSEFFAFLAVLAWGSWASWRHAGHLKLDAPVTVLLCLSILVILQYVSGKIAFFGDAALILYYLLLCICSCWLVQMYGDHTKWAKILAWILLIAAEVSAVMALCQVFWVWLDSGWVLWPSGFRRSGANLGQANHLGALLIMGAASLIYLLEYQRMGRLLLFLLSSLLLLGMCATESRTGLISGLTLCLWWYMRRGAFTETVRWSWIILFGLVLFVAMWVWPFVVTPIHEGGYSVLVAQTSPSIARAAGSRLYVWQQLCEAILENPWLGWGLRNTSVALSAVVHNYSMSEPFSYAHNIILELMVGIGVPMSLLISLFVIVWGGRTIRAAKTPTAWYAVSVLIPFVVHSMFEYPYAYAYFLVPITIAVGILNEDTRSYFNKNIAHVLVRICLSVFSLLTIYIAVEYLSVEEDFRVARFEALKVGQTPTDYDRPRILLLTQLGALAESVRTNPVPGMTEEQIELQRKVALRFPWAVLQNNYALSLALNGYTDEAGRQLNVVRAMHGDNTYRTLILNWHQLAAERYPQLNTTLAMKN